MKIWKAFGLAGLAGVAATGVIIARDQRKRSELTPAEIKDRLHQRLGAGASTGAPDPVPRPPRSAVASVVQRVRWQGAGRKAGRPPVD